MTDKRENSGSPFQCPRTRFSEDGHTAFVCLQVDRRDYEYAKSWAMFHAAAYPTGTAEDQLEAHLNMALLQAIDEDDWQAPPEIEALYPKRKQRKRWPADIPF